MGRWTFQDGSPLYIPDPGEEGGGSILGHLATGLGLTAEDALNSLMSAPVSPATDMTVGDLMTAAGMPARAVTAVGHSRNPAGYQGTTDPIDYIVTGEKNRPGDLAHYGDLLADTMEAEGTVKEGSAFSKAIRGAGELASDPVFLAGALELASHPGGRAPGLRDRSVAPRQSWAERMGPPKRGGAGTPVPVAKGGPMPKAPAPEPPPGAPPEPMTFGENPKLKKGGGPRMTPPKPRVEYRQPPIEPEAAAKSPSAPLDRDMASPGAFTTGGTKNLAAGAERPPKGATAARRASRRSTAREMGRQEQLAEGQRAMEAEFAPGGRPPRPSIRDFLMSAVENGADIGDVMNLLINFGG